ncbi:group II intron maturase-specific domain-containing protein [Massilia arenae]|uniref:group II intron maturase-specific domain-containing protein n=1 Tax=Massilia arenae TaxID=2603288 RepID=UPI001E4D9D7A|nr:group II intron maturase-specific domain-containing protein [Massilia arenae]
MDGPERRGKTCGGEDGAGGVSAKDSATHSQSGRRSIAQVIERLRGYVLGWKAYFVLAQTSGVLRTLDEWMRHRLHALHL